MQPYFNINIRNIERENLNYVEVVYKIAMVRSSSTLFPELACLETNFWYV